MKTRDLIQQLQELDPEGNLEVVIGATEPILFAERIPAYYDGSLQILERDPARKPYYDVIGARVVRSGEKIRLHPYSIETLLADNPEAPVDLTDASDHDRARVERWREEARRAEGEATL